MMALAAPETIKYKPVMNAIAASADRGFAKKLPPAIKIRIPKTRYSHQHLDSAAIFFAILAPFNLRL